MAVALVRVVDVLKGIADARIFFMELKADLNHTFCDNIKYYI